MNDIKFYVDFDRTIFNTDELYLMVKKLREEYGINENIWQEYVKIYKEKHNGLYNMYNILYEVCLYENFNFNILNKLDSLITEQSNKLVYNDVSRFLNKIKILNLQINMLTFGDSKFQSKKVSNTNISRKFDKIIYTSVNKFQKDDEVDYKNGIFFDDNPKDVEGLYERNPLKVFRIRRDGVKYSDIDLKYSDIEEVKSLDDIDLEDLDLPKELVRTKNLYF